VRSERRNEIRSDLWEHQHDPAMHAKGPAGAGVAIFGRVLAGAPSDLGWRWQVGRGRLLSLRRPLGLYVRLALLIPLALVVAQIGRYAPRSASIYWVGGTGYAVFLLSLLASVVVTLVMVARGVHRVWRAVRRHHP